MTPGEVLKKIPGLSREQLEYYVRARYIHPKIIVRGGRNYREYSNKDFQIVKQAFRDITEHKMQVRAAFEKATQDYC